MMNTNNEEDHRQLAAARAACAVYRAARAVYRAAAIAAAIVADDNVVVAADVDAAARVATFSCVDGVDAAAAVAAAPPPPPASFLGLDDHIRVNILNYLGETNDELITLTLVSKQVNKDCKQPGIEWKIIPTIEIRPRPRQQGGSTLALLQQLCNRHNIRRSHYTHMRVYDVHKTSGQSETELLEELADIPNNYSILSLDISLSKPMVVLMVLPNILNIILPDLREINLSNICTNVSMDPNANVLNNIPHLEKVMWNNIIDYTNDVRVRMCGWEMRKAKNLKEIIMDNFNSEFRMPMSMIDNTRNIFLFFYCSQALERVSIRNLIWGSMYCRQNILIKFVRNVPTLRWFRSDLSEENMIMLRLERPDIEFLN